MKRRKDVHIPLRGTVFFYIQANPEEKDNYLTTTTTTRKKSRKIVVKEQEPFTRI